MLTVLDTITPRIWSITPFLVRAPGPQNPVGGPVHRKTFVVLLMNVKNAKVFSLVNLSVFTVYFKTGTIYVYWNLFTKFLKTMGIFEKRV